MKIQGRVTIKKDGVTLNTKPGAEIQMGGFPRTFVPNDQGGGGHMEGELIPGQITCTVIVDEKFRADGFDGTDLTLEWIADNGLAYTINEGFLTNPLTISKGEAQVVYQGLPAVQI